MYVEDSRDLNNEAVANNSMVVISGSTYDKVDIYCYSNSTLWDVGYFVLYNGYRTSSRSNYNYYSISRTSSSLGPSGIRIHSYSSYRPRYSGIFTCELPDSEGNTIMNSIGIYSSTPSMLTH